MVFGRLECVQDWRVLADGNGRANHVHRQKLLETLHRSGNGRGLAKPLNADFLSYFSSWLSTVLRHGGGEAGLCQLIFYHEAVVIEWERNECFLYAV